FLVLISIPQPSCMNRNFLASAFFLLLFDHQNVRAQKTVQVLSVPAKTEYTHIDTGGRTVLASGRYLTPAGTTLQIPHSPFGLALSPDGSKTVTLHNGVITIIDNNSLKTISVGWVGNAPASNGPQFVIDSFKRSIPSPFSHGSFL